jgi:hypothetical protein
MFQPLEDAADNFADARDALMEARANGDVQTATAALVSAFNYANAILQFLGFVTPYECGQCDNCRAKADAEADHEADEFRARAAETIATDLEFWDLIRASDLNPETNGNTEENDK